MRYYSQVLDNFPYAGIFAVLILGGLGFPFPEDLVIMITGASVANGALGLAPSFIVIYPALLISDFILYSSGRKFGRPLLEKGALRKFISGEKLAKLEAGFKRRSFIYILFGRSFGVFRASLFIIAGVSGMPALEFIVVDAVAALISVSIMLGIGYLGGNSLRIILSDISRFEHVILVAAVVLLALWITFRFYKSKIWQIRIYVSEKRARRD